MHLLPYCEIDGIRTVPDSAVGVLFDRMVADRTFRRVFADGIVRSKDDFIVSLKGCETYFAMVGNDVAGIVWLTDHYQRTAVGHWVIFSHFWGGQQPAQIFTVMVNTLLGMRAENGEYEFDAIFGFVPETNRLAVRLVTGNPRCRVVGRLPKMMRNSYTGDVVRAIFVCISREDE